MISFNMILLNKKMLTIYKFDFNELNVYNFYVDFVKPTYYKT